jgi:hypothetical protein
MIRHWEIARPEPELVPESALSTELVLPSAPARSGLLPPIQCRPEEVLDMAREGVNPVTLCREFEIAPVTLRATMTRDANAQGY